MYDLFGRRKLFYRAIGIRWQFCLMMICGSKISKRSLQNRCWIMTSHFKANAPVWYFCEKCKKRVFLGGRTYWSRRSRRDGLEKMYSQVMALLSLDLFSFDQNHPWTPPNFALNLDKIILLGGKSECFFEVESLMLKPCLRGRYPIWLTDIVKWMVGWFNRHLDIKTSLVQSGRLSN